MEASSVARRGGLAFPRSRRLLAALPDERLVDQLRRGNEVAFEVIYDRHHRRILSFCRHMLGSREEAEDAVQQTFISAYDDLASGDREINLKPWLFTIARNRCLSMLRARREQAVDGRSGRGGPAPRRSPRAALRPRRAARGPARRPRPLRAP
jgi:DNA-directed RNA polymerase specialized sigma24 family protein